METEELKTGQDSSGKGIIPAGQTEVEIGTSLVNNNSKIYLTIEGESYSRIISYENIV